MLVNSSLSDYCVACVPFHTRNILLKQVFRVQKEVFSYRHRSHIKAAFEMIWRPDATAYIDEHNSAHKAPTPCSDECGCFYRFAVNLAVNFFFTAFIAILTKSLAVNGFEPLLSFMPGTSSTTVEPQVYF